MLVLLIVFMIATPTINGAVKVNLPKASVEKSADIHSMCIVIDKDGRLFLCDHPVTSKELIQRLRVLPSAVTEGLSIHADRQLPYEIVMKNIALLAKEGFSRLNLVIEGVS